MVPDALKRPGPLLFGVRVSGDMQRTRASRPARTRRSRRCGSNSSAALAIAVGLSAHSAPRLPTPAFGEYPEHLQLLSDVAVEHPSIANYGRSGDAHFRRHRDRCHPLQHPGTELLRGPPPPALPARPRTLWTVAGERQVVAASNWSCANRSGDRWASRGRRPRRSKPARDVMDHPIEEREQVLVGRRGSSAKPSMAS
jgi:hypothetical protein